MTASSQTYPILTADQFIAQETSAGAVLSIARFLRKDKGGPTPNPDAARVRAVGYEVARLTGMELGGRRIKKPANDNRRGKYDRQHFVRRAV